MRRYLQCFFVVLLAALFVVTIIIGCDKMNKISATANKVLADSWYEKFNWKAEDFFDDPKVIALCKAIEAKDLKEIDRLVAAGADVNAKGKGNMTPLLWAYPENKPDVFKRILEHGADPKIEVTSDFNTKMSAITPGDSVQHLAAKTWFPNYFKYVMQHGGDPNFVNGGRHGLSRNPPLITVITGSYPNKKESVQILIDAGADLEYKSAEGRTPVWWAASWFFQYPLALQLLEAGASFHICNEDSGLTFLRFLIREYERTYPHSSPQRKRAYAELYEWLEAHGADFDEARKDSAYRKKYGKLPPKRIAELKKRYTDDLAAKKAAKEKKLQESLDAEQKTKEKQGI